MSRCASSIMAQTRYKPIRSAIHNFAASFCSTLNYVDNDYGIEHVARAAYEARVNQVIIHWLRDGKVLLPTTVEPTQVANRRVRETLARYAARWPGLLNSMGLTVEQFGRIDMRWDFDWTMPHPFGPLTLTMEAEDDRGKLYEVRVKDFGQPFVTPEPAVGRRWVPAFWRWFGLGAFVAVITALPSEPRD